METTKTRQTTPRKMYIDAKVMSGVRATFMDENDKVLKYYDGPVPKFMPEEHWGDYIRLEIDLKTGRILNWDATKKNVGTFMNDPNRADNFSDPEPDTEPDTEPDPAPETE